MSRWLKFSKEPIAGPFEHREQKPPQHLYQKPHGFWFTDESEDNWASWCRASKYFLEGLARVHEVHLDESKILFLRSSEELISFTRKWSLAKPWRFNLSEGTDYIIDWPSVAAAYSGIIITPYQWECRLDPYIGWYYNWDCASGCVWDAGAILSVNLLETVE